MFAEHAQPCAVFLGWVMVEAAVLEGEDGTHLAEQFRELLILWVYDVVRRFGCIEKDRFFDAMSVYV